MLNLCSCLCPCIKRTDSSSSSLEEEMLSGEDQKTFSVAVSYIEGVVGGLITTGGNSRIQRFLSKGQVLVIKTARNKEEQEGISREKEILEKLRFSGAKAAPINYLKGVYSLPEGDGLVFEKFTCSLATYIEGYGKPSIENVRYIAFQVVEALLFLKEEGVVHGDVNPKNILLRKNSTLVLADFGGSVITNSGQSVTHYTTNYASPEFLLRLDRKNHSIDVWGAACSICELFSGKVLFAGEYDQSVMLRQQARLGFLYKDLVEGFGPRSLDARVTRCAKDIESQVMVSPPLKKWLGVGSDTREQAFLSFCEKGLAPNYLTRIGVESWRNDSFLPESN